MVNRHRGEIEAILDDTSYRLCLTLGALAELEAAFGDDDMLALAERFKSGRISARDAIRVIAAGLRGAGHQVSDDDVSRMRSDDAVAGYVTIVGRLLAATFGSGDAASPQRPEPTELLRASADVSAPFPGPR